MSKNLEQIKELKKDAEQKIFKILHDLEIESGMKYISMSKETQFGGWADKWESISIELRI